MAMSKPGICGAFRGSGRTEGALKVDVGDPETHSPDDAGAEANRLKGQSAAGADPAADRRAKAEATPRFSPRR